MRSLIIFLVAMCMSVSVGATEQKKPMKMSKSTPTSIKVNSDNVYKNKIDKSVTTTSKADSKSMSEAVSKSVSESVSKSAAGASSDNTLDLSGSGDSNRFYALSLMFPSASGCFGGVQGGGEDGGASNGDGVSGFLGFTILNNDCWTHRMAGMEQDVEINSRLKCGGKKYRNAVAFDYPRFARKPSEKYPKGRISRQAACVAITSESGYAKIKYENERLQTEVMRITQQHNAVVVERGKDNAECKESKARMTEAWSNSTCGQAK